MDVGLPITRTFINCDPDCAAVALRLPRSAATVAKEPKIGMVDMASADDLTVHIAVSTL